ncbi:DUF6888 family protein [Nostoc sp.]|uniref:DUF6888 family protein n=1 Tax=Nostoc sp. TaxID=1180 RepID=UPI003FA5E45A
MNHKGGEIEPTPEQLKSFYRMSVRMSNLLRPINLVRMDERTKRVVMLREFDEPLPALN